MGRKYGLENCKNVEMRVLRKPKSPWKRIFKAAHTHTQFFQEVGPSWNQLRPVFIDMLGLYVFSDPSEKILSRSTTEHDSLQKTFFRRHVSILYIRNPDSFNTSLICSGLLFDMS